MSKVSVYDAWCDGSYRDAHNRGGAGWVIRHDGQLREGSVAIPKLDRLSRPHGSDVAEVTAVAHALRDIPAGSVVKMRLDCQNVIDWLKAGEITTRKKHDAAALTSVFSQAYSLAQSMQLEIIKVSGAHNEHHGRAHVLSRTACAPSKPA